MISSFFWFVALVLLVWFTAKPFFRLPLPQYFLGRLRYFVYTRPWLIKLLQWFGYPTAFDAHHIVDGVWLGSFFAACNETKIRNELQVTHVVSVATGLAPVHDGIEYLVIDVRDVPEEDLLRHLDGAVDFIESALKKNKGKVFVHCMAGISRSATVVAAWLIRTKQMKPAEAIEFIRRQRSVIAPNRGFVAQLDVYHQRHSMPNLQAK